jgi:DNA-binding transcriptional regulator GbsR (MarR family)
MPESAPSPATRPAPASPAELRAADAVGALMELWGFKRQLGRTWTVLFLAERPLAAPELCERLQISTGLLSMTLAELRAWEVVRIVPVPGERREHYQAETHVWRMVRQVLGRRERRALEEALAAFEAALVELRREAADADPAARAAARFRAQRLARLAAFTRGGLGLLGALLESARVDLGPLKALSDTLAGRGRG